MAASGNGDALFIAGFQIDVMAAAAGLAKKF